MPSSAASNAGLRCGAAVTTIATLGLADLHASQAVDHSDAPDGVRCRDARAEVRHHLDRHRLVAFVFEIQRAPPLVLLRTMPSKATTAPSSHAEHTGSRVA